VALRGQVVFAPRRGNEASFVRTDQWLGAPLAPVDPRQARAELVRHYLHAYGPSRAQHFAEWAGIAPAQAARAWALVEQELVEVRRGVRKGWVLQRDLAALETPPTPVGVRFLPAHDPYLQLRDREILSPDRAIQQRIWRTAGSPGVVLTGGRLAATWRPTKRGQQLRITIALLVPVPGQVRTEIEAEAATLAPFKGCRSATVEFADPG
jgi:hypothetical protein